MNVTFVASDPHERAAPHLDAVLSAGADQLAIACAFLTDGGVEALKRHAKRLQLAQSFIVVAWELPTAPEVVNRLHDLCPGNVYVHLGVKTPYERGLGRGLMHSKVFLATRGKECLLWTGSHNLTASAMVGANCEAAIVLQGFADEAPFQSAREHLERCRQDAIRYDPLNPPEPPGGGQWTLIIHAEAHVAPRMPRWFVHFRPTSTAYDTLIRQGLPVWLYLYQPGALSEHVRSEPTAAYSGVMTGVNMTSSNPLTGIEAEWSAAAYVIDERKRVFCLDSPTPHLGNPTQGVIRIDREEDSKTLWLVNPPQAEVELIPGESWTTPIDARFAQFFSKKSVASGQLVHRPYRGLRLSYSVSDLEVSSSDKATLPERLRLPASTEIDVGEARGSDGRLPFVYKARFRV